MPGVKELLGPMSVAGLQVSGPHLSRGRNPLTGHYVGAVQEQRPVEIFATCARVYYGLVGASMSS